MKILIVTSSGGHLYKTFKLKPWWSQYERVWVTKLDKFSINVLKGEKIIEGNFPENRNFINFLKNFVLAFSVIFTEKPDLVFSMGAGIAPPFFFLAKILNVNSIFIETFISIKQATLSGRMIYPFANHFFVQNKGLQMIYKKSIYLGSIL